VVASNRLVQASGKRRVLPAFRNRLARDLLRAAGTDAERIRTAEMAAALALGRRDLVPQERRDRWRRSGLAHLLAVSGLHVGLVGGAVWLLLALGGASPKLTRVAVLVALPAYAILAGAAPSAMRAALMAAIYLAARLLGRAVLPMAAVLLAVTTLLVAQPSLIASAGFQLTVVITAALVRWVPPLTTFFFGPRWLTGAIAVPVVAQTAAAPLVAWHFRTAIPGAIVANLLALPLLAPIILGSVATAVIAPLWRAPAALGLDLVGLLVSVLRFISAPARAAELVTPPVPVVAAVLLIVAGWIGLQARSWARFGAAAWIGILVSLGVSWALLRPPAPATVELLPVSDGAAVLISRDGDAVLSDAGRYRREASQLLAESGHRDLRAVIASHTDEDHVGGVVQILRSFDVERLVVPAWMFSQPQVVPMLRAARRGGTRVDAVAAGTTIGLGTIRLEVVWPPAARPPRLENERSIVVRAVFEQGTALITAWSRLDLAEPPGGSGARGGVDPRRARKHPRPSARGGPPAPRRASHPVSVSSARRKMWCDLGWGEMGTIPLKHFEFRISNFGFIGAGTGGRALGACCPRLNAFLQRVFVFELILRLTFFLPLPRHRGYVENPKFEIRNSKSVANRPDAKIGSLR
jgi:competence protein ComEC